MAQMKEQIDILVVYDSRRFIGSENQDNILTTV